MLSTHNFLKVLLWLHAYTSCNMPVSVHVPADKPAGVAAPLLRGEDGRD